VAWSLYYRTPERRATAIITPPRWLGGWTGAFCLNAVIVISMTIGGLGMGGYSSVVALIEAIGSFGVFAKCYNC
jgi:hypothetical protein